MSRSSRGAVGLASAATAPDLTARKLATAIAGRPRGEAACDHGVRRGAEAPDDLPRHGEHPFEIPHGDEPLPNRTWSGAPSSVLTVGSAPAGNPARKTSFPSCVTHPGPGCPCPIGMAVMHRDGGHADAHDGRIERHRTHPRTASAGGKKRCLSSVGIQRSRTNG
jgi:hypothetical protein